MLFSFFFFFFFCVCSAGTPRKEHETTMCPKVILRKKLRVELLIRPFRYAAEKRDFLLIIQSPRMIISSRPPGTNTVHHTCTDDGTGIIELQTWFDSSVHRVSQHGLMVALEWSPSPFPLIVRPERQKENTICNPSSAYTFSGTRILLCFSTR